MLLLKTQLGRKINLTLAGIMSIRRYLVLINGSPLICGLGRPDFHHIVRICGVKFYFHILHVKHTLLNNMYCIYSSSKHSKDCDLAVAGFKCRHDLCSDNYEHFRLLCF